MSRAMVRANLPSDVPPYFCTSHGAAGSALFWCRFGGVVGGEGEGEPSESRADGEDGGEGEGAADILFYLCATAGCADGFWIGGGVCARDGGAVRVLVLYYTTSSGRS
jgi:hypothetical protein